MIQGQLFRNTDPHTSHEAAAKVDTFKAGHEAKIYEAICNEVLGLNHREIAYIKQMEPVQVGRRLKGMERRKLITRRRNEVTGKYLERDGCALWFRR